MDYQSSSSRSERVGNERDASRVDVRPETEELVAYLDGELSDDEAARVETRLAEEQAYREHLKTLQQTWDMLDALPRAEVTEGFTRSTVEMVAVAAERDMTTSLRVQQRSRYLRWGAALAVSVLLAFAGFALVRSRTNREHLQLVHDLPVIERLDEYREIEDVDFLEKLASTGLFDEEVSDAP